MAVYQIFASADATIYSRYPIKNTGRDEVLEVSVKNSQDGVAFYNKQQLLTQNPYYTYDLAANDNYSTTDELFPESDIRRAVLQFSNTDITKLKTFASQSVSGSYEANLKLSLAFAQNLNTTYSLQAYALTQSWTMGTGRFAQVPQSTNGVSWLYTGPSASSAAWTTGGGSWNTVLTGSQYFDYMANKDVNMDITTIMNSWFTGSVKNRGLIIKQPTVVENDPNAFLDLKFFSVDTHTIYPPCLEYKWNDFSFNTGSNTNGFITSDNFVINVGNNLGEFKRDTKYNFNIKARDKFPTRQYTTSSVYLNWKYLPTSSYWAIQDYKTTEMIVDFDESYTKISADTNGNYFTVYMNGLQPERTYKLLVKADISGSEEVVVDNDILFKIVR